MDAVWLLLAFAGGGCVGFILFAVLRISREATRRPKPDFKVVLHAFELEGDTVTRF